MSVELVYTSAPHGLKQGSRGFCTVVSTAGMPINLASRLEGLSAYRHVFTPQDPSAHLNPVCFSHLRVTVGGRSLSILSRIAAYGVDYSQRTNKIAHHVVLDANERSPCGPIYLMQQESLFAKTWDGECRTPATGPKIPVIELQPSVCHEWQRIKGDAGWAGSLAEVFSKPAGKPLWIIFELEQSTVLLNLIAESIAILSPAQRWGATFSTYFTNLAPDVECKVRCVLAGTEEARLAPARGSVITLAKIEMAPNTPSTAAARDGKYVVSEPVSVPSLPLNDSHRSESLAEQTPSLPTSGIDVAIHLAPPDVRGSNSNSRRRKLVEDTSHSISGSTERGRWVIVAGACTFICALLTVVAFLLIPWGAINIVDLGKINQKENEEKVDMDRSKELGEHNSPNNGGVQSQATTNSTAPEIVKEHQPPGSTSTQLDEVPKYISPTIDIIEPKEEIAIFDPTGISFKGTSAHDVNSKGSVKLFVQARRSTGVFTYLQDVPQDDINAEGNWTTHIEGSKLVDFSAVRFAIQVDGGEPVPSRKIIQLKPNCLVGEIDLDILAAKKLKIQFYFKYTDGPPTQYRFEAQQEKLFSLLSKGPFIEHLVPPTNAPHLFSLRIIELVTSKDFVKLEIDFSKSKVKEAEFPLIVSLLNNFVREGEAGSGIKKTETEILADKFKTFKKEVNDLYTYCAEVQKKLELVQNKSSKEQITLLQRLGGNLTSLQQKDEIWTSSKEIIKQHADLLSDTEKWDDWFPLTINSIKSIREKPAIIESLIVKLDEIDKHRKEIVNRITKLSESLKAIDDKMIPLSSGLEFVKRPAEQGNFPSSSDVVSVGKPLNFWLKLSIGKAK